MEVVLFAVPEAPVEHKKTLPKQLLAAVEMKLEGNDYAGALRVLSGMLSGRYVMPRELYATLWRHMMIARSPAAAHACYEGLKLLQNAFPFAGPPSPAWGPSEHRDVELLHEALIQCIPDSVIERSAKSNCTWSFPLVVHSKDCAEHRSDDPVVIRPGEAPTCNSKKTKCKTVGSSVSEHYPLLLQFFVSSLMENARLVLSTTGNTSYSAVVNLLTKDGKMQSWFDTASPILQGLGTMALSPAVSDTFHRLLHLLIEGCGTRNCSDVEHVVYVWIVTYGVDYIGAGAANFNDSFGDFLHRSKWWNMKLLFVDALLLKFFSSKEVKLSTLAAVTPMKPAWSLLADRFVHVYFSLRTHAKGSSIDDRFDAETLVILVGTAWQCAVSLKQEAPTIWENIMANKESIKQSFSQFEQKIGRLATMRGNNENTSERSKLYLMLLKELLMKL